MFAGEKFAKVLNQSLICRGSPKVPWRKTGGFSHLDLELANWLGKQKTNGKTVRQRMRNGIHDRDIRSDGKFSTSSPLHSTLYTILSFFLPFSFTSYLQHQLKPFFHPISHSLFLFLSSCSKSCFPYSRILRI